MSGTRSAVILCGGRSTRMGSDKASLPFRGEPLLARCVRLVRRAAGDVVVVARPGQALPELPPDVRVVRDDAEDRGPLGGLGPGLRASRAAIAFVTGCDAPFLVAEAIAYVVGRLETAGDADAAAVVEDGRPSPLFAAYRTSLAPEAERRVAAGDLRATALLDGVRTLRIDASELRAADPHLRSLVNCNTPDALAAALAAAGPWVRITVVADPAAGTRGCDVEVEAATLGAALHEAAERLAGHVPAAFRDGRLPTGWSARLGDGAVVGGAGAPLRPGSSLTLGPWPGND